MTMIARKRNVPGYIDEQGRFRPIRSAKFVGSGSGKRKATIRDRKKYSRPKAGDLGKVRQERALEAPWDREYRLDQEAKAADAKERARIEKEIARDVYGETSGRMSSGKAQSLAQFVRSQGGINTAARVRRGVKRYGDLENFTRKGSGTTGLVTTLKGKGKGLDTMWQLARQSGFDLVSSDDLLDRLDDEIRSGKMTYATHGSLTYNPIEMILWGHRKGDPDWAEEVITTKAEHHAAAKKWAKENGFDKFRVSKLDLSKAPDFKGTVRKNPAGKKNPIDLIGTFANLAVGISSAMHIDEAMKRRTRKPAAKRRGTTKAKTTARRSNPSRMSTVKAKGGELYVLTIQRGDDEVGIFLHDGNANGFSKEVKTLAAARAYAKRTGRKLVENPTKFGKSPAYSVKLQNEDGHFFFGVSVLAKNATIAKKHALVIAKRDFGFISPKVKITATKINPAGARTGKKTATRAKANPRPSAKTPRPARKNPPKVKVQRPKVNAAKARKTKVNAAARVPVRRTFEMFQGRPATTAKRLPVSRHAPARLDQLGDLIEVKLNSGKVLDFSKRNFKLCAAGGKLWIAGGKIAKLNPAAAANEINPIDSIDHVVYGTSKPHHGDHAYTHYIHKLGEESGHMPTLCVDREGFPLIRGGKYKIEARGIVN